jgi:hypothetical protein
MTPLNPIVEALLCRLDDNLREMFEERAGILQFEAGNPREVAEPLALLDVLRMSPLAVANLVCLRASLAGAPVFVIARDEPAANTALAALGATGASRVDLSMAVAHLGGSARLTALD